MLLIRYEIIMMQNVMALFAVPGLSASSVTTDRLVNASKVLWAILSPVDNAFRMYAHQRFRAPSQVCALAGVVNGVAREWFVASEPCAIL